MELTTQELKKKLQQRSLPNSFLVLVYPDNNFLAKHYLEEIIKLRNKDRVYVESLNGIRQGLNMFENDDSNIYVLNTQALKTTSTLFNEYQNVIVLCNGVEKDTEALLKASGDVLLVKLPKLQEWQILDYMRALCKGIDDAQLKWLYDTVGGDIYRLYNEISKIAIFEPSVQSDVFNLINEDGGYSDLSSLNIYNFTNAIIKRDKKTIHSILKEISSIDVEGVGLITILHKNFLNIINIQLNTKATPESLGMKENQFKAISYSLNKFTSTQLINIFDFITSLDIKLKSGNLQMSNEKLIDFIVCNVLSY